MVAGAWPAWSFAKLRGMDLSRRGMKGPLTLRCNALPPNGTPGYSRNYEAPDGRQRMADMDLCEISRWRTWTFGQLLGPGQVLRGSRNVASI